jgi:hypothetical protein
MSIMAKVFIGLGIAAVGVGAVVALHEHKYATVNENQQKDDKTFFKRIKEVAEKKAMEILTWSLNHLDTLRAVGAIFSVVGGALEVGYHAKKIYSSLKETKSQMCNRGWSAGYTCYNEMPVACAKLGSTYAFIDKDGNEIAKYKAKEA